jgi:uncharacterized protein (DUF111 family)
MLPAEVQVHLDLVGGLAGDMFAAALLDAFPEHEARVLAAVDAAFVADQPVTATLVSHGDGVFRGRRFLVAREVQSQATTEAAARLSLAPRTGRRGARAGSHEHTTWRELRVGLERAAALPEAVRRHAIGIFQLLADAEARVHGIPADAVAFHEVGAWDSRADIVAAAALIDAIGASHWTSSPAPLGGGRAPSDHGLLPLPAPATAVLLEGFATIDDGIPGERVTPTGAAILRYLCSSDNSRRPSQPAVRTLLASGIGFGGRTLPGISNHTRVLVFEARAAACAAACAAARAAAGAAASTPAHGAAYAAQAREIHVVEFEVDDQSAEDLATGLERLRSLPAVLDVTHAPVFGKKGRMMAQIRVLARRGTLDEVVDACFRETTTIGLRHRLVQGIGLKRHIEQVTVDGHALRVKLVERPGRVTAKAESDDLSAHEEHWRRAQLRARAESAALAAGDVDASA